MRTDFINFETRMDRNPQKDPQKFKNCAIVFWKSYRGTCSHCEVFPGVPDGRLLPVNGLG
jgi:hypothetical protein